MANAIFTTKVNPVYDDLPELRYHFPSTYLNQVKQAVGDWIIYYEPRREGSDLSGRAGRQCYFATARVVRIENDNSRTGHFYAYMADYLEFSNPVPFKIGQEYPEMSLQKADGSTNRGRFGRSVRVISPEEFQSISRLGFLDMPHEAENRVATDVFAEDPVEYGRPRKMLIMERPFREAAFTRIVREEYHNTCAMTGLRLTNGKGRFETEAAHIKPVSENGPDSPRNGIALSRTIHWLFDRHFLSISDGGEILIAEKFVPEKVLGLLNPDRRIKIPASLAYRPHQIFLRYHQDKFKLVANS